MKNYLKIGGLLLSSLLTISLFVRLFGLGAYGILMSLAALALFEGGAVAWNHLIPKAKHDQRQIAKAAQWFCVGTSIVSSGAELILGTHLWEAPFDVPFFTLLIIVAALAVNVIGVILFEQSDPNVAAVNRELDRQAKSGQEKERLADAILDQALMKTESRVAEIAGDVSDKISGDLSDDVRRFLLSRSTGRHSTTTVLPLPPLGEAPPLPQPTADLSQWSIYAVARALIEQYGFTEVNAIAAASLLITGKPPAQISEAQLRARLKRPSTIPQIAPEIATKAKSVIGVQ